MDHNKIKFKSSEKYKNIITYNWIVFNWWFWKFDLDLYWQSYDIQKIMTVQMGLYVTLYMFLVDIFLCLLISFKIHPRQFCRELNSPLFKTNGNESYVRFNFNFVALYFRKIKISSEILSFMAWMCHKTKEI